MADTDETAELDEQIAQGAAGTATARALFQTPYLRWAQFRQATPAPEQGQGADPALPRASERTLTDLYTAAAAIGDAQATANAALTDLLTAVQSGIALLTQAARPGLSQSISLKASQAVILDTQGYKHSYLLLTATQSVAFDIPGVGSFTRSLAADWNRLDYPSGTRITVASDPTSPINALLRLTDEPIDV